MARHEIVIARYNEDVSWAENLPAVVYNKGEPLKTRLEQRNLPNVGREGHTYLTHIIEHWNDLADVTLFTQAGLHDHVPQGTDLDRIFEAVADITVPQLLQLREWGDDGRLKHIGIWLDKLNTGRMLRSRLSLVEWFQTYIGIDPIALGQLQYMPGAIMAVKKDCIQRRPIDFFRTLLGTISHHVDPEEGHYLERAWMYVFAAPKATVRALGR